MSIVTVQSDHPEGLALAAFELALKRAQSAQRIVKRIGTDGNPGSYAGDRTSADRIRRKFAARVALEAATQLRAAAVILEAGL